MGINDGMKRIATTALVALLSVGLPATAATKHCRRGRTCTGTARDDRLTGTSAKDVMFGFEGIDVMRGRRAADEMHGGKGQDRLAGGHGRDEIDGDDRNDGLNGGRGDDILDGGKGPGKGRDTYIFHWRWGHDRIVDLVRPRERAPNDFKNDVVMNIHTDDLVIRLHSSARPEIRNNSGSATVNWSNDVIDHLISGNADDQIWGNRDRNYIDARDGADVVYAGKGDDLVFAGQGDGADLIDCGEGFDVVHFDESEDTVQNCEVLNL